MVLYTDATFKALRSISRDLDHVVNGLRGNTINDADKERLKNLAVLFNKYLHECQR